MAAPWKKLLRGASVQRDLSDLKALFMRYAFEETVKPLKTLGRFVVVGLIGSLFVGVGVTLSLVGLLRLLQTYAFFNGTWSWLSYVIDAVAGCVVIALTLWRVRAGAAKRRSTR
jgi:hypothetical protein